MKPQHRIPVAWLLTLALVAGCSNSNTGDGSDMTGGMTESDMAGGADMAGGMTGADGKQLTCAEMAVCIISCRATGGMNCETTCASNASADAKTKFAAVAACLLVACSLGANAPCQNMSSAACQTCVMNALGNGGACRMQAQSCGL